MSTVESAVSSTLGVFFSHSQDSIWGLIQLLGQTATHLQGQLDWGVLLCLLSWCGLLCWGDLSSACPVGPVLLRSFLSSLGAVNDSCSVTARAVFSPAGAVPPSAGSSLLLTASCGRLSFLFPCGLLANDIQTKEPLCLKMPLWFPNNWTSRLWVYFPASCLIASHRQKKSAAYCEANIPWRLLGSQWVTQAFYFEFYLRLLKFPGWRSSLQIVQPEWLWKEEKKI